MAHSLSATMSLICQTRLSKRPRAPVEGHAVLDSSRQTPQGDG